MSGRGERKELLALIVEVEEEHENIEWFLDMGLVVMGGVINGDDWLVVAE